MATSRKLIKDTITMTGNAAKIAFRIADKGSSHMFKWATTDHLGVSCYLMNMPKMGFFDTLQFIGMTFLAGIIGAVVAAGLTFIGIAYVIPAILGFAFTVLFR